MFGRPPSRSGSPRGGAERGRLKPGKVFPHGPAKMLFFVSMGVVVVTHIIALCMYFVDAGPAR